MAPKKPEAAGAATATKRAGVKKAAPATKKAAAATTTKKAVTKAKATATTTAASKRKTAAMKQSAEEDAKEAAAQPKKRTATKATTKPATKTAAKPAAKKSAAAAKKATPATSGESDKENETAEDTKPKANTKRKRAVTKDEEAETEAEEGEKPAKKARTTARAAPKKAASPAPKVGKKINEAPTEPLDVFVFGEGSSGELGLGSKKVDGKKPIDVKRPRLNANLAADKVGVVQISCGGMHVMALTKDNKILTWGVNDQGALGRDTTWDGGLRDVDDEDSDDEDSDDSGLNPKESTPDVVDTTNVIPGTKFVQVAACDSASFALTEDGVVYGWGTFRNSDGLLGFNATVDVQKIPVLIDNVSGITQIAAGSNHVLALDNKGKVHAWGSGQQHQLGRKIFDHDPKSSLKPKGVGAMPVRGSKAVRVACGSYHSFVVDQKGRVFGWGLNNYAELGIEDNAGEDDAAEMRPRHIKSLRDYKIADIDGGEHHSLACTESGELLTWGRIDGHQVGLPDDVFTKENAIFDDRKKARILKDPTAVPGVTSVTSVAAGTDHSFAITSEGKTYSWGFSANYQTGQGTDDDIEIPTLIDNTAVRGKKIIFAGAGGQYSVLASAAEAPAN